MQYRNLADTGVKLSALSLGGWASFGDVLKDEAAVKAIVARAHEKGVNFFDMADAYARGGSERIMGMALARLPRHELVLSSKVFRPMSDDVNDRGLSRKHIFESIDRSLRRIGTDYLDIYFCHRDDPDTAIDDTVRAMDDLVRAGKILYWGTSEWPAGKIEAAIDVAGRFLHRPRVEQSHYNLLERARVESELAPLVDANRLALTVYAPLASGLLSGKYDAGLPAGSRLQRLDAQREQWYRPDRIERVRRFRQVADAIGATRSQVALAWLLTRKRVASVITGATSLAQLEENLAAADLALDDAALGAIDALFTGADAGHAGR